MKIVTAVGARPQFVKAACLSRALIHAGDAHEVLVHTGQHFDDNMSRVFFEELDIPDPAYHLGISSGSHGVMTGRMLAALEEVLMEERPDWVVVYGDTNSTLAAALAAAKLRIPIAHVEAGLRSFNRAMPEEVNRVLTDHAADLLLTPTDTALDNLRREGIPERRMRNVGDIMYDAALFYGERAERSRLLAQLGLTPREYVLATVHRAENTNDGHRLRRTVQALRAVSDRVPVVWPLHPRTRAAARNAGLDLCSHPGLLVLEPVGYLDMLALERAASVIVTDSGGVQKEAFFYRVPCVTLRDETEWVELVQAGWNRIVPPTLDAADVAASVFDAAASEGEQVAPYGNGRTAAAIVEALRAGATAYESGPQRS